MSSTIYSFLFKALTISTGAVLLANVSVDVEEPYSGQAQEWAIIADTLTDSTKKNIDRSGNQLIMRWKDFYSNRIAEPRPRSPFYLRDPTNIATSIVLDSAGKVAVSENIQTPDGNLKFRAPERMDLETYDKIQEDRAFRSLLREYAGRQDGKSAMGARGLLPKLDIPPGLSKLLGDDFINFKPTGFVSLDLGLMHQFLDNPAIPIRQRRNTQFIFNEQISINFDARLGDQLGFQTNFDTKANFNFENAIKLNYKNPEESFIRKIEAGNINWAINSQLIPGVQNLFGLKTDFQFGRLNATFVASQQKSSKERIVLRGGAQSRDFELKADTYDENRNFFLSQYFRNIYEGSLQNTPTITSGVTVTRIEVYVTNRTTTTESLRNIVGFADLGEPAPYKSANPSLQPIRSTSPADNAANGLYKTLTSTESFRQVDNANSAITSLGFEKTLDYELLRGAKRLIAERDYTFNPQLGYISLTNALRNDEVLAVSYEYTLNGRSFKVGELTEDYQARGDDEVIALKLLKSSTIRNNTKLPMWDLMMKNIYSLGTSQIDKQGFQLRVIYKDDQTGIDNPNLQESSIANVPLIRLMGLDRLNPVNDLQPDGNFDFVEGITVDSKSGRIIFPVLEPFGTNLSKKFGAGEDQFRSKYVFNELYRTTMIDAQQITERNKFYIKGSYQSSGGAEVQLPFGVLETSVTVTSGGAPLSPGSDYIVEAQIGRVRLLNSSVLNSGREIVIEYERPDMFQNQIRTLLGTRLDYLVNRDMSLGMTAIKYRERTAGFLKRVSIGNEPVNNTMIGFDINFRKDVPFLTKWLDALPLLQTKEMSSIQFKGEVAKLFPGVSKDVNNRSLVDDFEATRTIYDLSRQPQKWRLASVPPEFRTGVDSKTLNYGFKRAKISAYTVDNIFGGAQGLGGGYEPPTNINDDDRKNFYERLFLPNEIFPNRAIAGLVTYPQNILDIAYYPSEKGMYNYNTDLNADGRLKNPVQNFGGLSRAITSDNDFDNANIESIEFWMLDPFITGDQGKVRDGFEDKSNTTGGKLVFNLGDISEDVIPDERYNFENGLPIVDKIVGTNVDSTAWGYVTKSQYLINAFSNESGARERQDVGLDGMNNDEERVFYKQYLDRLPASLSPQARARIIADPSGDDFQFFLGSDLDSADAKVLQRYKNYIGMENNSPESRGTATDVTPASTNVPDGEDMNVDNTINDNESYYSYEIDLKPNQLAIGNGYIVDKTVTDGQNWYLFRVPIREFTGVVGSMSGFKSIRFMRMYLTGFQQPVVLRFAQLQMVGQQYRKYTSNLDAPGLQEVPEPYDARFTVGTVSIEENSQANSGANKYVYKIPPGWQRDQDATQRPPLLLNEQSMNLCVTDLRDGDSRAVYKNVSLDLLFRKRLRMYIHMQNEQNEDRMVGAFMRIGTDLTQNYYEIDLSTLRATLPGDRPDTEVWPEENELNIALADLIEAKAQRNRQIDRNLSLPYTITTSDGRYKLTVVGNPDLSAVRVMMIGMRNPKSVDERPKTFCIWVNEMHVEGFDETGGIAAIAQLNAKLADFATLTASGRMETFGFGSVQQRIGERSRNFTTEYGLSSNIALDKLLPQSWGFSIPLFVSYDRRNVKPHFNPLDPDTPLNTSLDNLLSDEDRDGYRRLVEENTVKRGINFSNVHKVKMNQGAKNHFYDFENFSFTYAFSDDKRRNILTQEYAQRMYKGGISYVYSSQPKAFEPFKKWTAVSRWTDLIKDFNLTLLPNTVSIRTDVDRRFLKTQLRNADLTTEGIQPLYEKYFWFNRYYDFSWNLTRNVTLTYNSSANSIIDEPMGDINTAAKKDSLWSNFKKLGRIKNFDQKIDLTYRLPLDKIPLTDWMTADYKHSVAYQYQANALGLKDTTGLPFGDIIRNSRERGINGKVDFVLLYNKLRYLKFANTPTVARKNFARSPGDIEDIDMRTTDVLKTLTRALMTVRGINVSYSVLETTSLPGYLRAPKYFGIDNTNAPGLPFVLGQQDRNFQMKAAEKGWITKSEQQNMPFQQTIAKNFSANTTLEPFKDFRLIIEARLTRQDAYQEFYRPDASGNFASQSPLRNGQFSMSFMSFRTAFAKMRRDNSSPVFDKFRAYRAVLRDRLNQENPTSGEYNETSQDVLISSFFAAYRGKDPLTVRTNPFLKFPMPNWDLSYNGLSQLPMFKKLFSSFSLKHKYMSNYSVGNFTSSLDYEALYVNLAVMGYPLSSRLNELGQYIPVFAMSTITLAERFQPLVGVEFRTQSRVTARIEYNRDRTVALNISNSQMAELFNQDVTVNIGFTKNNVAIPFKINGVKKKLKNDMTMQLAMTFRDTRSIQRKFDGENIPIAGNINFQLRPTVNYLVNNRLSVQFYFDRTFNDPLVSNSFYRASTSGGVQLKFNLAE
ncbi:T9SS outer membrane translocon Sov/SprA [Dyadobacter sediminis]|uniref:Cell surface protein SprA n=1 Tax=Dyadobacter sediminis TaxID=1493691 RepID=A0A5R9K8V4_9BACT|nr:cell surface protein SprA [Dyadobacter sediminis]TLU90529.1 cell surface protein SprA [Dyadobacter sediminis]GGC08527.1 cell surface protein SprA [Dyadobacter sediminis]